MLSPSPYRVLLPLVSVSSFYRAVSVCIHACVYSLFELPAGPMGPRPVNYISPFGGCVSGDGRPSSIGNKLGDSQQLLESKCFSGVVRFAQY